MGEADVEKADISIALGRCVFSACKQFVVRGSIVSENELVERLLAGDRRALARIISKIEGEDLEVPDIISDLYPRTGEATTIGFTGPPGGGKGSILPTAIEP